VDGNRIFNVDTAVEIFIDLDILVGVLRADLIEVIGFGEEPGGAGDRTNHRREGGGNNVETDDLVSITAQGADERLTQMARTSGYQDLSVLHLAHNKPAPASCISLRVRSLDLPRATVNPHIYRSMMIIQQRLRVLTGCPKGSRKRCARPGQEEPVSLRSCFDP
jgi:hypothetical protein